MFVRAIVILVAFSSFFVFDAAFFVVQSVVIRRFAADEKKVRGAVVIVGIKVASILRSRSDPNVLVDC